MGSQPEASRSNLFCHAFHFIQHDTRLNNAHPWIRELFLYPSWFSAGFSCKWFIGENTNPYFYHPLNIAGHGNTGRFNLTRIKPAAFRLPCETNSPKIVFIPLQGLPDIRPFLWFSMFFTRFGIKHLLRAPIVHIKALLYRVNSPLKSTLWYR